MTERSRIPVAVASVVFLLAIIAAIFWREAQQSRAQVGQPAPAFTLPDLSGRQVSLVDFRGEVLFLNFWTTWCDGCIVEMPALVTFHQRYGHKLRQVGIDVQEPPPAVEAFLAEFGVAYDTLLDQRSQVPDRYRLRAFPESWFIDGDGVARYHKPGLMSFEEMVAAYELTSGVSLDTPHEVTAGPAIGQARAILLDSETVWVGGSEGLWRWSHGQWEAVSVGEVGSVYMLHLAPNGSLYVGTDLGLLLSVDGGHTWADEAPDLPPGPVTGMAVDGEGAVVWVAGQGLYRQGDSRWEHIATDLNIAYPWVRLAARPDGMLFAATPDGLLQSDDRGLSWRSTMHRQPVYDIAVNDSSLLLVGEDGLYEVRGDSELTYSGVLPGRERWLKIFAGAPARRLSAISTGTDVVVLAPNGDMYRSQPGQWQLIWPKLREDD